MISRSLQETHEIAAAFVGRLVPRGGRAALVALQGDLGSGKTSFAQGVGRALGVEGPVQSPTFVIEKSYEAVHPHFKKLVHIDAYRLESARELERLAWKETLSDPGTLVLLEWPERVEGALPEGAEAVAFEFVDETTRKITFQNGEEANG